MIFPGDATFKKVNTGRANDRVYVLKYSSGSSLMFWMQDKNAEKDEEICTKINTYINDLTAAHAALTTNASATSTAPAIGGLAAGMGRVNTPGGVNADQVYLFIISQIQLWHLLTSYFAFFQINSVDANHGLRGCHPFLNRHDAHSPLCSRDEYGRN